MEHLLDGASVVSPLDDIEGDALADLDERTGRLLQRERFALADRVESVAFLKFLSKLFLHFKIAFISSQRVAVIGFDFVLFGSFFLVEKRGTRLIGFRYFFTCSYSLSFSSLS